MFFLLRAAFWLTVVLMFIPGNPETGAEAPRVTLVQAFVAARATVADLSGFCDRNPDVCTTSSAAFQLLAAKAENGVRLLYRYLDGSKDSDKTQDTLKREDIEPAWHDPHAGGAA
jgi:hypothetical protein